MKKTIAIIFILVAASGCKTSQQSASTITSDITEKYWKLVELNGQKITPNENQTKEPHFILKREENRVMGHGGCNSFHGTYELLEGGRIRFSKIASSLMACDVMETEKQFLQVLEMADN